MGPLLMMAREIVGVERLMFGIDYPFIDASLAYVEKPKYLESRESDDLRWKRRDIARTKVKTGRAGRCVTTNAPLKEPAVGLQFPDLPVYQRFHHLMRFEGNIFNLEVEGISHLRSRAPFIAAVPTRSSRCSSTQTFTSKATAWSQPSVLRRTRRLLRLLRSHRQVQGRARRPSRPLRRVSQPIYRDPSVQGMVRGNANTHVMFHAGKLLALKEDSPPVAMDPFTLATLGHDYFDGKFKSETFTAHPRVDPKTGEMFGFGYSAKGVGTPDVPHSISCPPPRP